jgi:PAP2 superfamily
LAHQYLNPLNVHAEFTIAAIAGALVAVQRADLLPALGLGLAFEALRTAFLLWRHVSFLGTLGSVGFGFWCAVVALALRRALGARGDARWPALDAAAMAFALPLTIPLLAYFIWLTSVLLPKTYDMYLYAFDGVLPVPVAQITADAFFRSPPLYQFFWWVYHTLIAALGLYIVLERKPGGQLSGKLMSRWLLAGCLGFMLYFLVPAIGPEMTFGDKFPFGMPDPNDVDLRLLYVAGDAPRSTFPSLHSAWVFLIAMAARTMPAPARAGALLFMAATLISTLGLRQHYLVDLVAALPFALAVEGIASFSDSRADNGWSVVAVTTGGAMTFVWILAVRYGVEQFREAPWVASALVVVTIVAFFWVLARQGRVRAPVESAQRETTANEILSRGANEARVSKTATNAFFDPVDAAF